MKRRRVPPAKLLLTLFNLVWLVLEGEESFVAKETNFLIAKADDTRGQEQKAT